MIKTAQKTGKIKIPQGKKVAVSLSCIFSGAAIWTGPNGEVSQFAVSRGEHDAMVCVPRILDALKGHNIKATFFIPGHTADTFPETCKAIVAAGHEVAHHSYMVTEHSEMALEEEEKAFEMGFAALKRIDVEPKGFRAPNEFSSNTMSLLEKYRFQYDCSLMGNDLSPYYPRPVILHADTGCEFGKPSSVLELPVSLHLDDYPFMNTMGRDFTLPYFDCAPGQELLDRVKDTFEFASRYEGSMMNLTIHTGASGNRPRMASFEEMLTWLDENGAWIAACCELADAIIPESFE